MHRIVTLFVIVCVALVSGGYSPAVVHGQFATNTPSGAPDANAQATENPDSSGGGFSFATNTPAGPAPTATASPSATPTITPTPTATFTPTNTPTPTPIPIGPFSYPQGINPLTGLPYPDEAAVARRNLIVKISNYPPIVRPQHGVNAADVVYEYEAEGGVTRFAAIYRSQAPERVGSVRSARLIDIELVTMYRALLAYSGTSAPIQNLLLGEGFFEYQLISPSVGHPESATNDCDTTVFCRNTSLLDSGTPREHTLFGNTNLMWDIATRQGSNTGYVAFGFAFNEQADANGRPALDIDIDWWGQTDSRWQYDEASGRYVRYTDGVAHFDAADGEQLWADNLIMVEVPHVDRPDLFPAGASYTSLGIELWDQGFVYVMREGQVYQGYWRRRDREPGSALQIIYGDNTPIMLKPGRTWVTLVRGLGNVVVSAEKVDVQATATVLALTPSPTPLDLPGD